MNECRYRVGDALLAISMLLCVIGVSVAGAVTVHWAWASPAVFVGLTFVIGSLMNRSERKREVIQKVRAERQRLLGVPPEETI